MIHRFAQRRRQLMERLPPNSAVLIAAAPEQIRSRDIKYPYRPGSDFYYLTGFTEPNALILLLPGHKQAPFTLFVQPQDALTEVWSGQVVGLEGAKETYGADNAYDIATLDEQLPELLSTCSQLYYPLGQDKTMDERVASWGATLREKNPTAPAAELSDVQLLLHEMRLVKDAHEIECMRKAVDISVQAHLRAMHMCKPGHAERTIEAELLHTFISAGCQSPAYPPIVAAGGNGCVLHYMSNQDPLVDGELLLVDAAAEYNYYAADITRTYPINGRFSKEQRAIYDLVLGAQDATIQAVKPGVDWETLRDIPARHITQGLIELGLLHGEQDTLLEQKAYQQFYMHGIGHWLGLDVHDVGEYKPLASGMALTIEPGIYIRPDESVDKKWWGIAVRIEDDVLVTDTGADVLSGALPKTADDIEAIVGKDA